MERLVALSTGKPLDRIPVFCNLIDQGAAELGMKLKDYYSNGECVAEAQLRMQAKYGYDQLWSLFYVGKEAELLGCKNIIFAENGSPNVGELVIKTPEDIHNLQIPEDISDHPALAEPLKCLRILARESGGKCPVCAYVTGSMSLPAILMGMEKWLGLLFGGSNELRDELLAKCSEFVQKQIAVYRNAGANLIVYANPFCSTDILPLKMVRELAVKWVQRDLRPIGVSDVVYYSGSVRLNPILEAMMQATEIKVYYLGPQDDVAEAKNIIAGRGLCVGVINDIKLVSWSQEEIRNEVKRIITAGMPGGGFAFGTLVMPYLIPEENIRVMVEAAYACGRY